MKAHHDRLEMQKRENQMNMLEKNSQDVLPPSFTREMETPQIVKSINRGITSMREDAYQQAVDKTHQTVSNRQAFDLMYPSHKAYYEDKKFFVFDNNYKDMEGALINTFEKAVNEGFGDKNVKAQGKGRINNIRHVDEIKDHKINVDFGMIPAVL